ncbi:MAG: APC family permease, partial [Victivallaceae bacterium]
VIIALLTSWLAFTIMIAQIPYAAAQDGNFPRVFTRENSKSTPSVSLWVTSFTMQLTMVFVYFATNAWNSMLSITSIMIVPPYMACTAYLWKLCLSGEYPADAPVKKAFAWIYGLFGTLFCIWMLYSGGLNYVLMTFIFLAAGIPFFIWARKDANKKAGTPEAKIFTGKEIIAIIIILLAALAALIYIGSEEWKKYETKTPPHRAKISELNKHLPKAAEDKKPEVKKQD